MQLKVGPGSRRSQDDQAGRVTRHSFSFGAHYDPDNIAFGAMRAFDDHRLEPGAGFDLHRHSDIELVTWVLEGCLIHTDADGVVTELPAGSVQVQSAGEGVRHGEHACPEHGPTRFLQSWLVPDSPDRAPTRVSTLLSALLSAGSTLLPAAGASAPLPVDVDGATLWVGRLSSGASVELPPARRFFLFCASGRIVVSGLDSGNVVLAEGDDLRCSEVVAPQRGTFTISVDGGLEQGEDAVAEVLIWALN